MNSLRYLLLLFLFVPAMIFGQPPVKSVRNNKTAATLPLDPAVRTGKLANGFTYYIRHNEEPKNRVIMYLVNMAGSILEDENQRGLAHFMEHMNFNGTKHFPKNELVNYLQKSGIRFGADLNAYTSFDETVYQLPIPSDNPELLKGGLQIMRDWASEATLDPAEIDKERGVVLEEKRLGKGAGERMQQVYLPVLLANSRYATRVPIGLDTVLNNFKPSAIERFYKEWYRPDLQALIIVGDINVDAMEVTIKQQFASLRNPSNEKPRVKYAVPLTGNNDFITVTDKEMTGTVAEVMIKHRELPFVTEADYRREIVHNLFNEMLAGRYAELNRKADVPFIQASAGLSAFMGGLDSYDANVVAKPGELENSFKALWRETERVKRFGFTITELQRAKASYLNNMGTALSEKNKTYSGNYVQEYVALFLKGTPSPGISREYQLTKVALPAITLADVNNLTKEYLRETNRVVMIMAPEKDKNSLPDEATVNRWMHMVAAENLLPYQDEVNLQPLLTREPAPGTIVRETLDKQLNITTIVLSNGVKVFLKPTDFKHDEIIFGAFAPGGSSLYPDKDYESATNAAEIISSAGVGNYNQDQLSKYLQDKQFSVSPYIGERTQGISGTSTVKDLQKALEMIYANFTEPRMDTAVFRGIILKSKAGLINRGNDPGSVFNDTVSAILGNNNIRRTGPSVEKIDKINLADSYRIYYERFADALNFTFTFVGNFEVNAIKPLLVRYIGSLPATNSREQAKNLGIHIPDGRIEKTVYKGSEPKASVLLVFSGKLDYTQQNKANLDALKESLEIRLLQRLREDESGVYSPGVSASLYKFPESRFNLIVQFGCAPQNADKLVSATLEEIQKLKTQGPPLENIDKWRAEDKTEMEPLLKTNGFWLGYIEGKLQDGDQLDQIYNYPVVRDRVNPESVRKMAASCLNGENYIRLQLVPEKAGKVM